MHLSGVYDTRFTRLFQHGWRNLPGPLRNPGAAHDAGVRVKDSAAVRDHPSIGTGCADGARFGPRANREVGISTDPNSSPVIAAAADWANSFGSGSPGRKGPDGEVDAADLPSAERGLLTAKRGANPIFARFQSWR